MNKKLSDLYLRLSRAGASGLNPLASKRVILINHVALSMALLGIFFFFMWIIRGNFFMALTNVGLTLAQLSFVWLNHRRRFSIVAALIIVSVFTPIFVFLGMDGRQYNFQYCFIPMAGFSILLFELEEKKKIALAVLYPMVLLAILEVYDYRLFPNLIGPPPGFIVYFAYAMNFVTVLVLTLYLFRAHNQAELKYQYLYDEHLKAQKLIDEERARTIFSSRMIALGEMAGGIAHEINNPLALIIMSSEQLIKGVEKRRLSDEKLTDLAGKILNTGHRISMIIKSLSAFSRISQSRPPLRPASLYAVVEDTMIICKHRFDMHGVALRVNFDLDLPQINCRPIEVGQVLLNLLNNAFDAVSHLSQGEVRLDLKTRSDKVLLSVSDNGPGIPKEVRPKIFEAFFTTKDVGKGTGLGLSISKRLMEENEGKLYLLEGSPTTFVMEFGTGVATA